MENEEDRMSVKKQYLKTKSVCKVTFNLPKDIAKSAGSVYLVGDASSHPMKLQKDGSFNLTINLEKGGEYQYRYLLDGSTWENDDCADKYVKSPYGDSENSIVVI
jgi:1,4-alpha-glucan branching enzyme